MKTFIIYILILFTSVGILSCQDNTTQQDGEAKEDNKALVAQEKHLLFNGELELLLDKKFKPYTLAELITLSRKMQKNVFMQSILNEEQLQLIENLGLSYVVFVDTTNYSNVIQLENLDELIAINKEAASVIGGLLKKKVQVSDPGAQVEIESAKFGAQPTFTYGYYKMKSISDKLITFSNHYAMSSSKSTFILYNISTQDHDFSYLKNQISFQ